MHKMKEGATLSQIVLAQCSSCGKTFQLSPAELHKVETKMPDGKLIWITYFNCPSCKHIHFVQIDDVRTNKLLIELGKVFASTSKAMRCGGSVKKQSARYRYINRNLSDIRKSLEEECSGLIVSLPGYTNPMPIVIDKLVCK